MKVEKKYQRFLINLGIWDWFSVWMVLGEAKQRVKLYKGEIEVHREFW